MTLSKKSITALFWSTAGSILRVILQFGVQVVLTRLLGPTEYGVFAIGAMVVSLSTFVADMGIAYGLIQKDKLTDDDIRFVFTWQLITGLLVSGIIAMASSSIAIFFNSPRSEDIVLALSGVCFLNAIIAPSQNILIRSLSYKTLQIARVGGYIIGYVIVGIPLAVYGNQVWSLVAAWLVQSIFILIVTYSSVRHSLRPLFWYVDAVRTLRFGLTVLGTNLINWAIGNIDRVIVGRMFDGRQLGFYSSNYNMLYNSTSAFVGAVQPVFYATISRISNQRKKIVEIYLGLLNITIVLIFPVFICLSVLAEIIVPALYGSAWSESAGLFRPLALAMPFYIFFAWSTPLVWVLGKGQNEMFFQLPMCLVWMVASYFSALYFGIYYLAWSVVGLFFLRAVIFITIALKYGRTSLNDFFDSQLKGVIFLVVFSLISASLDISLGKIESLDIVKIISQGVVFIFFYTLALLFPSIIFNKLASQLIWKVASRFPLNIRNLFIGFERYK